MNIYWQVGVFLPLFNPHMASRWRHTCARIQYLVDSVLAGNACFFASQWNVRCIRFTQVQNVWMWDCWKELQIYLLPLFGLLAVGKFCVTCQTATWGTGHYWGRCCLSSLRLLSRVFSCELSAYCQIGNISHIHHKNTAGVTRDRES